MTKQKKVSGVQKNAQLYADVHCFIQNVYPDFYSKCWLGEGKFDKHVDNFIDRLVEELKNETD